MPDAAFATACTTARPVAAYSKAKGEKFYLVQHYEEHLCGKEEVDATWRLPMFKVVSSSWLLDIGAALGVAGECTHIPYGIELDVFQLRRPLSERNQYRVGMLAHHWTSKGLVHGVDALARAKEAVAGLEAVVFGVIPRPDRAPGLGRIRARPIPGRLGRALQLVFGVPPFEFDRGLGADRCRGDGMRVCVCRI